ncbi:MAG: tol-pal system protein YbgF [Thermoanaerobaculia bacterium]|nr:tol-pal system protein YbgF [Thermoanaerobaculia bacterium]
MRAAIALLMLLTLGCSAQVFSGGSDELASDVAELEKKVLDLQRQATVDQVEIERLRKKVAALEEQSAAAPPADEVRAEADARGIDDEVVPAPRAVEVIEIADLEEPLEEEAPPESDPTAVPAGGTEAAPTAVTAAAQALYDQGYSLYHQGRHAQAEATFGRFLVDYGSTDLGDNAQYWIGECRLAQQDNEGAMEAFRATVQRYPEGNKTPDALLKLGVVMERLGDVEGARSSYREVRRRFPESPASSQAAQRLEAL